MFSCCATDDSSPVEAVTANTVNHLDEKPPAESRQTSDKDETTVGSERSDDTMALVLDKDDTMAPEKPEAEQPEPKAEEKPAPKEKIVGFVEEASPAPDPPSDAPKPAETIPVEVNETKTTAVEDTPRDYQVQVKKTHPSVGFGVMFEMSNDTLPIVLSISPGSLVDEWNAKRLDGERKVAVGDALLDVNGQAYADSTKMVLALRAMGDTTVTFKPPKIRKVVIRKEGKELGMKLRLGELGMIVHSSEGLAAAAGVCPKDRIVKVNTKESDPKDLYQLLNRFDAVELEVHSFSD